MQVSLKSTWRICQSISPLPIISYLVLEKTQALAGFCPSQSQSFECYCLFLTNKDNRKHLKHCVKNCPMLLGHRVHYPIEKHSNVVRYQLIF